MRLLTGSETPREFRARVSVRLGATQAPDGGLFPVLLVIVEGQTAAISVRPDLLA